MPRRFLPPTSPIAAFALLVACGGTGSPTPAPVARAPLAPDTYAFDLTALADARGYVAMPNSAIAFALDATQPWRAVTGESVDVQEIYNRFPCARSQQEATQSSVDTFYADFVTIAPRSTMHVRSVTVDVPVVVGDSPGGPFCLAYRTSDGAWHGRLLGVPVPYVGGETATVTLPIDADDVDLVAVQINGTITGLSYVAVNRS